MRRLTATILACAVLLSAAFAPLAAAAEEPAVDGGVWEEPVLAAEAELGAGGETDEIAVGATGVLVTADDGADVGKTLTGTHTAGEGATFQWKRSDAWNKTFTNIDGANQETYVVQEEDYGKYIKFAVTPQGGGEQVSDNAAVGGNLAFGRTATIDYTHGNGKPERLTDGKTHGTNGNNDYCSGYSSATFASHMIDLGGEQTINQMKVNIHPTGKITHFKVEYTMDDRPSDATALKEWNKLDSSYWTTAVQGMDTSKWQDKTIDFLPAQAKHVRFCVTGVNTSNGNPLRVGEIEAYNVTRTAPLIVANGELDVKTLLGQPYEDLGAKAAGPDGTDLTGNIVVNNPVDTNKLGSYNVTYDLDGAAQVVRKVTVYADPVKLDAPDGIGVGQTLTASYNNSAYDTAAFQWQRSAALDSGYTDIVGQTEKSYTLAKEDEGKYVRLAVKLGDGIDVVYSSNAIGVGNLAYGKSAILNYGLTSGNVAANLTDGDIKTGLTTSSGSNNNSTTAVDLGTAQKFNRVVVRNITTSKKIYDFKVQYTNVEQPAEKEALNAWKAIDSADWTDVENASVGTDEENWKLQNITFNEVQARYVRFCVTRVYTGWSGSFDIKELEVYAPAAQDPPGPSGEKPEITLKGDAAMYVAMGTAFTDPGAAAADKDGGDLTAAIGVTGSVNPARAGVYLLHYDVQGADGTAADRVTRTVTVYDGDKVTVSAPDGTGVGAALRGAYKPEYDVAGTTYQWQSSSMDADAFTNIEGATNRTYTIQQSDIGKRLRLVVTPSGAEAVTSANAASVGNLAFGRTADALILEPGATPGEGTTKEALTDGDRNTMTKSAWGSTTSAYYIIDLGAVQPVNQMKVYVDNPDKIYEFEVQVSSTTTEDGRVDTLKPAQGVETHWQTVAKGADRTKWTSKTFDFFQTDARYVRFCVTVARNGGARFGIREIELYKVARTAPVMQLNGDPEMRVLLGHTFDDPGAAAQAPDGSDISGQITVEGSVNVKKTGDYTLTYKLEGADPLTRKVTVYADPVKVTAPSGTGYGKTLEISYENSDYDGAGVTFQWSRADKLNGTYTTVEGATQKTYAIQPEDMGKYLRCTLTLGAGIDPVATVNAARVGNLAFGKTAYLSYTAFESTPENLTDGGFNTYVRTQSSKTPGAHMVDLGSAQYVDQMRLLKYSGSPSIIGYKIQYTNTPRPESGDDLTAWNDYKNEAGIWTDVVTEDSGIDNSNWSDKLIAFEPVKARYFRFCATEFYDWSGVAQLRELELMNTHAAQKPVITLNGEAEMSVQQGETFTDPGAKALDVDGLSEISVTTGGDTVNTAAVGTYTITYNATGSDGTAADQVTRTVKVVSSKPVITLKGEAEIKISLGGTFTDPGATASGADGDLTANIVIGGDTVDTSKVGTYVITYDVTDAQGNKADQVTRTVKVVSTKPVIVLNGEAEPRIAKGGSFTDPGAVCYDTDGNPTVEVSASGTVDPKRAGVYQITYTAAGADMAVRTVIVYDGDKVLVSAPQGTQPGAVVYGAYKADYDAPGALYQWYRAEDLNGTFTAIEGAMDKTYTIGQDDSGNYLQLRVMVGGETYQSENAVGVGNLAFEQPVTMNITPKTGVPADLTDGNLKTNCGHWSTSNGITHMIDLGEAKDFNTMVIRVNTGTYKIKTFRVEYSNAENPGTAVDSADWTLLAEETNTTGENWKTKRVEFYGVNARYVRFVVTEINTGWSGAVMVQEIEVYQALTQNPQIRLLGDETVHVAMNGTYTEPGFEALFCNGQPANDAVTVAGLVDTGVPGTYVLTYNVKDPSGPTASVQRTVVVDAPPLYVTAESGNHVGDTVGVTYEDTGYDAPGITFQWMRAVEPDGDYEPISGATQKTYQLTEQDKDKYIRIGFVMKPGTDPVISLNAVACGDLLYATQPQVAGSVNSGTAADLTDGNSRTGIVFDMTGVQPQLTMDLGEKAGVNLVRVYTMAGQASVTGYTLEYYDSADGALAGGEWKPIDTQDSSLDRLLFDQIEARYLRLTITGADGATVGVSGVEAHRAAAPPVIKLVGEAEMDIPQDGKFTDPGASATDSNGADISSKIVVTGSVDTTKLGSYTLTYDVRDGNGTAAKSVTRTVNVVPKTITLTWDTLMPGGTLRAAYEWDGYGIENADYQWLRSETIKEGFEEIPGATGETYELSPADIGKYIKLRITPSAVGDSAISTNAASVGNLAIGKKITASSLRDPVANMVDGNYTTGFGAYSTVVENKIVIDLEEVQSISRVKIYNESSQAKIYRFALQYSPLASPQEEDWITLSEIEDKSNWTVKDIRFDRVQARQVRMHITEVNLTWSGAYSLRELEIYNAATAPPVITLNGDSTMRLERGTAFVDPGVTAADETGVDLTALVQVSGDTVNTDVLGTYTITYNVTDGYGNVAQPVSRTVIVHEPDTQPPVIYLNGSPQIRVHQGSVFEDPGAYAVDNIDGTLPVTVGGDTVNTAVLGEYVITYDAADSKGNRAQQKTRKVIVVGAGEDVEPPVVTLKGAAEVEVWQGYSYEESGATALDDGVDVSNKIKIEGSVNTAELGDYTLTYSVSDAAGNIGVAVRIVHVVPEPAIERDTRELKIEGASNLQAITSDLILRVKGKYGSAITWSSSNENVIRPDGTVIRPSGSDASVVLTATIRNGEEVRTKVFDPVTVLKDNNSGGTGGGGGGGGGRPGGGSTVTGSGGSTGPIVPQPGPQPTPQPDGTGTLSGFSDMHQAAWADLAVSELAKRGIISGMGDGTFQPDRAVTREEFVKIIVEAFGFGSDVATAEFSDVSAQEWYYPYVAAAAQLGIVSGSGDGIFGTGRAITREEMAAMICRAAQVKGIDLQTNKEKQAFTDDGAISDWAKEDVYALQQAGVISGMGDGNFAPGQESTRAEAAKLVYELTKYMW